MMMKVSVGSEHLLVAAGAALAVLSGSGVAGAASVRHAQDARPVGAPLHASPVNHRAVRRQVVGRARAPQTCTTVPISQNVQLDLEEPNQTATAAMVISSPGQYSGFNVDGTGCDIAVYISQATQNVTLSDSAIHDGTRAGIVADTTNATTLFGKYRL